MDAKLTLALDQELILKAKAFAKRNHTSLSRLLEQYLTELTKEGEKVVIDDISPLVKSLSGVLKLPDDFEHKADRTHFLEQKFK